MENKKYVIIGKYGFEIDGVVINKECELCKNEVSLKDIVYGEYDCEYVCYKIYHINCLVEKSQPLFNTFRIIEKEYNND